MGGWAVLRRTGLLQASLVAGAARGRRRGQAARGWHIGRDQRGGRSPRWGRSARQPIADAIDFAYATAVEQTADERREAAMALGGHVDADLATSKTAKRRQRRRRLEKMHAKMRRGKFWEIRDVHSELLALGKPAAP